jgi:hypothetical protein
MSGNWMVLVFECPVFGHSLYLAWDKFVDWKNLRRLVSGFPVGQLPSKGFLCDMAIVKS